MHPVYPNKLFIKDVWKIFHKFRLRFTILMSLRLLSSAMLLYVPYAIAKIIDFLTVYQKGESLQSFYSLLLSISIVSVTATILRLATKFYLKDISRQARAETRVRALSSLMNYDLAWHENKNTGEKVQQINNGVQGIHKIVQFFREDFPEIFVGIFGVAIAFSSFSLKYTAILGVFIVTYLFAEFKFNKKIALRMHDVKKYTEQVSGKIHEYTNNIATVKSLGLASKLLQKARYFEFKLWMYRRKAHLIGNRKWMVIQTISEIFLALLLLVVGIDIAGGVISVGMLVLFLDYIRRTKSGLNNLSRQSDMIIDAKYSIFRMVPYLRANFSKSGSRKFKSNWKRISIQNLSFSYHNKNIFQNLSFEIKRGEKIGLVGTSGQGKSTLFKLLLNLYQPTKGKILIDGIPL